MGRTYKTTAGEFPSVTTILALKDKSFILMPWAAKCVVEYLQKEVDKTGTLTLTSANSKKILYDAKTYYKKITEEACDIGSEVHGLIEGYVKFRIEGKEPLKPNWVIYDERVKNGFDAFLNWEKEHKVKWLESELMVWHEDGYAGTLDAVAVVDNILMVVDFKTSKAFYWGYLEQISAYARAYAKRSGKKVKGMGCLRLDKETGLPQWKSTKDGWTLKEAGDAFRKFKCLLKLYQLEKVKKIKKGG